MATPSWLLSWPATWPDIEAVYKSLIPSQVPKGLNDTDGEAWHDWVATGEALAQVRKVMEWMLRSYFPNRDIYGEVLERWESLLALGQRSDITDRQAWVVSKIRQTGTMTTALLIEIMAGAWGLLSGDTLSQYVPTAAVNAANPQPTDELQLRNNNYIHFYDTAETTAPDYDIATELAERAKATWELITVGRYEIMQYDDPDSGWDRGRWG